MENMHTDVRVNTGKGHGHPNNLWLTHTFLVGFVKYMKCQWWVTCIFSFLFSAQDDDVEVDEFPVDPEVCCVLSRRYVADYMYSSILITCQ